MGKLKVIKNRSNAVNRDYDGDLRGLGNDPLIKESHPSCFLALRGATVSEFESLLASLQLVSVEIDDYTLVEPKIRHEGEHKKQSLTLLALAVTIHKGNPSASMFMGQLNNLHDNMTKAIHGNMRHKDIYKAQIENWNSNSNTLTLDPACQLHLNHAGLPINVSDKNETLNAQQLFHLKEILEGPNQNHSRNSKTG